MGTVIIFIVIAGVIGGSVAIANRNKLTQEQQWQQTARDLGLGFSAGPQSARPVQSKHLLPQLYGQHDGQDIYVGVRTYTTGSGSNTQTHYRTFVDVVFDPALKRGLRAVHAGSVSKLFGKVFGQRDIQVGNEVFDRDHRVDGFDPEQIAQLLNRPRLMELLTRPIGKFQPDLNDYRVRFECGGVHIESALFKPVLGPAVQLYREALQSWTELPPSVEERQIEVAWATTAAEHELRFAPRGMRMLSSTGPVTVRAEVTVGDSVPWVHDAGWKTAISASFDPPLGVGLSLTREGITAKLGKFFGSQDIKLGDQAFDDHFMVKGTGPGQVKEILSPAARACLLNLANAGGELEVDDTQVKLVIADILSDANELTALITQVRDAANAMVAYRQPTAHGPYR